MHTFNAMADLHALSHIWHLCTLKLCLARICMASALGFGDIFGQCGQLAGDDLCIREMWLLRANSFLIITEQYVHCTRVLSTWLRLCFFKAAFDTYTLPHWSQICSNFRSWTCSMCAFRKPYSLNLKLHANRCESSSLLYFEICIHTCSCTHRIRTIYQEPNEPLSCAAWVCVF